MRITSESCTTAELRCWASIVNGWTISGITTYQSGGNLQSNSSQNLGLSIEKQDASGNDIEALTSKSYFGTDADSILPVVTCNPRAGLKSLQLVNLSCFSAPIVGQQGIRQVSPYLRGPIYTDSDLTVYKTFSHPETGEPCSSGLRHLTS